MQRDYSKQKVDEVSNLYGLGTLTSPQILGAITFPYIDILGNIRAIQVKEFDENQKTTPYGNRWFHSELERKLKKESSPIPQWLTDYKNNEKMVSCLFGEHLLSLYPNNPIALTEAWENGKVLPGKKIVLAAFGAGFTWGSVMINW
mgnify:CR=1 FL=1